MLSLAEEVIHPLQLADIADAQPDMRQFLNNGDQRSQGFCVHCGGQDETRDHSPSRVFLDEPFPENLPVTPACRACNNGFSLDEEYLASLLECVTSGDVAPDAFERQKIADIVRRGPGLAARLQAARRTEDGQVIWSFDEARVSRVILKLARGHAAFELNEPQCSEPSSMWFSPLVTMTDAYPSSRPHLASRAAAGAMFSGTWCRRRDWTETRLG